MKKEGTLATREYVQDMGELPTVLQYGPAGDGPGVQSGHFDIFRLYCRMPRIEGFVLAEECTICFKTSTDLANMIAVAPCCHVNVCVGCYNDMLAQNTLHAFKCAICRCERPKGAAGDAGFVK